MDKEYYTALFKDGISLRRIKTIVLCPKINRYVDLEICLDCKDNKGDMLDRGYIKCAVVPRGSRGKIYCFTCKSVTHNIKGCVKAHHEIAW